MIKYGGDLHSKRYGLSIVIIGNLNMVYLILMHFSNFLSFTWMFLSNY